MTIAGTAISCAAYLNPGTPTARTLQMYPATVSAILITGTAVIAMLLYKVYRGKKWARLLFTIWMSGGSFAVMLDLPDIFSGSVVNALLYAISIIVQTFAVFLLWKPAASAWFGARVQH